MLMLYFTAATRNRPDNDNRQSLDSPIYQQVFIVVDHSIGGGEGRRLSCWKKTTNVGVSLSHVSTATRTQSHAKNRCNLGYKVLIVCKDSLVSVFPGTVCVLRPAIRLFCDQQTSKPTTEINQTKIASFSSKFFLLLHFCFSSLNKKSKKSTLFTLSLSLSLSFPLSALRQ